jgi:hypothetical protein
VGVHTRAWFRELVMPLFIVAVVVRARTRSVLRRDGRSAVVAASPARVLPTAPRPRPLLAAGATIQWRRCARVRC